MSIIKSNNAGLHTPISDEWLEEKGIFDPSDLIIERYWTFESGWHDGMKISFWKYFQCSYHYPFSMGSEGLLEPTPTVHTKGKMLYHTWFPPKELVTKYDVIMMLREIQEAKDSLIEREMKMHAPNKLV